MRPDLMDRYIEEATRRKHIGKWLDQNWVYEAYVNVGIQVLWVVMDKRDGCPWEQVG